MIIFISQKPCVRTTKSFGEPVELSMDLTFEVKSNDEKFIYDWWVDDERIKGDDERFKVSSTGVLFIQEFEKTCEGQYKCIVSTTSQPVMSVSAEVELNLTGTKIYVKLE